LDVASSSHFIVDTLSPILSFQSTLQDNSDVKGARRIKWLASDKEYASGGYKKEQSVSIFGNGAGLDWTGTQSRSGPESLSAKPVKMGKNYKAPNVNDWAAAEKKKGPFGLW
jgi:hypothetical protein